MANQGLVKYLQDNLRKGYDSNTLRNFLIKNGHNSRDVDEAIRQAYGTEVRHTIHFSPTTMISIAGIFISLVVVSFLFLNFFNLGTPEMLLDLNLDPVNVNVKAGENVVFISEIDNLGSSKRYDVFLKYELIDIATNEIVSFKEETRAIETKGSKQIKVNVPLDLEPGNYMLRAIASYNGQKAVATLPVEIKEGEVIEELVVEEDETIQEEPIEETKEIEETKVEETEDNAVDSSIGNSALTTFETLEKVEKIAKQDKLGAEKSCNELQLQTSKDLCFNKMGEVLGDRSYCNKIIDERTKDVCLSNIAQIMDKSEICESISRESRKDNCYMKFVLPPKQDYTVCDKVINQYLRQSCESLKQLSKLNMTNVAFYESLINQSLFEFV